MGCKLGNARGMVGVGGVGNGRMRLWDYLMTTESDTSCRNPPELYRSHNPWRETNRRAQCEEIRKLRSMWRGLDTWQGRDDVTLALPKGRETGNTNFDLHRRASPRPYHLRRGSGIVSASMP